MAASFSASPVLLNLPEVLPCSTTKVMCSSICRKVPIFHLAAVSRPVKARETITTASSEKNTKKKMRTTSLPGRKWVSELNVMSTSGTLVQGGLVYREKICIKSFEIDINGKISLGALISYLQETALNHVRHISIVADGFGSTPQMCRNNLIWVLASMQIVVHSYPSWADVIQVDTWMYASGKNGLGREWVICDENTGKLLIRAARFTNEIRAEFLPFLVKSKPEKDKRKAFQLKVDAADYIRKGLMAGWTDMDINQHVNNVKYINWILQGVPGLLTETHELSAMTLEYRKECDSDKVLQSLTKIISNNTDHSMDDVIEFEHLLCLEDGTKIVRGWTIWKPKVANNHISVLAS